MTLFDTNNQTLLKLLKHLILRLDICLESIVGPSPASVFSPISMQICTIYSIRIKGGPLMIFGGGARAKAGKKLNGYSLGKKKLNSTT